MAAKDPWKTRAGRKLRAEVLRQEPTCRLRLPGCTRISTHVDHIIPRSQRPDLALVRSNCQGACAPCNYKRGSNTLEAVQTPRALGYFTKPVDTQQDSARRYA